MRRRSVMGGIWLAVGITFSVNTATSLAAGETVGYGFGIVTLLYFGLAGYSWVHPEPVERPDEPAPRRWFEIVGLVTMTLLVGLGLVAVTVGS